MIRDRSTTGSTLSKATIAIGAALALCLVAWWALKNPVDSIRYRLTLAVDVDGRRVIGSGVVQVDYVYDYFRFLNIDMPSNIPRLLPRASGEAVVVDLGVRGILFATLAADEGGDFWTETSVGSTSAERILPFAWGRPPVLQIKDLLPLHFLRWRKNLSFDKLPMLVRFRDLNDPKTLERVEPEKLAEFFGPGVRMVGAFIEITNDRIDFNIRNIIPWLANVISDDFNEEFRRNLKYGIPPVQGLHWRDFTRGYAQ